MTSQKISENKISENTVHDQYCNVPFGLVSPFENFARVYFKNLSEAGFLTPYQPLGPGRVMQLSRPICIPENLALEMADATKLSQRFVKDYYRSPEALFEHLYPRAPEFGGVKLITQSIIHDLYRYYINGDYCLPWANDIIFTTKGPKVVEFQSAFGYLAELEAGFSAASKASKLLGFEQLPDSSNFLGTPPREALRRFAETFAPGRDVWVLDLDALSDGSVGDRIELQAILGNRYKFPLDLKLIDQDRSGKIFFHEQARKGTELIFTGRHIYPEAVFSRVLPSELEQLYKRLVNTGETYKIKLVQRFFTSPSTIFLAHPLVTLLVDKAALPDLAEYAYDQIDPYSAYFPAMRRSGEALPEGDWALKPHSGNSAQGFGICRVKRIEDFVLERGMKLQALDGSRRQFAGQVSVDAPGLYEVSYEADTGATPEQKVNLLALVGGTDIFRVPAGHTAQERFDLMPIPVKLPESLASALADTGLVQPNGWIPATLEIRCFRYPSLKSELSTMFAYRLAPRENRAGELVLTNLGKAMRAYDELIEAGKLSGAALEAVRNQSLFGMGAVAITK